MTFEKNQTVREMAVNYPATIRVFESFGIDYCCGGRRPLTEACAAVNVPIDEVMKQLNELDAARVRSDAPCWTEAVLTDLTAHIVEHHHRYVRDEAPRLGALIEKVVSRHGDAHPELRAIQDTFGALSGELFAHMLKEERVLFPFIEQMDLGTRTSRPAPVGCFPSVEFPISRMLAEHDNAGVLTSRLRELSGGYEPPNDACPSYRGLYHGLAEFERDLHHHVHLENNVLFPRAVEMERQLRQT